MLKSEARKYFREKRRSISFSDKMRNDDLVLIHFQTLELPFLSSVLSFYPIEENNEVNTFIITDFMKFKYPGIEIAYPRTDPATLEMDALVSDEAYFQKNVFNIPEPLDGMVIKPDELELILVPMLGCDLKGNRVGYGKGFYDRFLKECDPDCIKIGLSHFEPVDSIDDANEFDVPLDLCITPERIYVF
jgi:5-formyltetrahydrofolate cyclo-ligase